MKTNYKKIKQALIRLEEARVEFQKIASLRIGMISGGPDIEEEKQEFDDARQEVERLVNEALKNKCRTSKLIEVLGDDFEYPWVKGIFESFEMY